MPTTRSYPHMLNEKKPKKRPLKEEPKPNLWDKMLKKGK